MRSSTYLFPAKRWKEEQTAGGPSNSSLWFPTPGPRASRQHGSRRLCDFEKRIPLLATAGVRLPAHAAGTAAVPGLNLFARARIAGAGFHFLQRFFVGREVFRRRGDVEAGRRHGVEETGSL